MSLESRITALAQAVGADIKALQTAGASTAPKLKRLLIYYGFPAAYKALWDDAAIIADIVSNVSHWVVGDTYQDPAHESYASTVAIIQGVRAAGVVVYGYVPIGQSTMNLTLGQIQTRIDQWGAVGVDGIFLDEFGFDYGNTRQKQINIVTYVHGKGLPYCANAWTVEDFTCDNISELTWATGDWRYVNFATYNPTNLTLPRNPTDAYLFENFGYSHLGPSTIWDMQERCMIVYQRTTAKSVQRWGVAVFPETTPGVLNTALMGSMTDLDDVGAYISANAYLYDVLIVGSNGYSFGSSGTSIPAPLYRLPDSAQAATAPATTDYAAKKGSRFFGPIQVTVTNTDTAQGVTVFDVDSQPMSGGYPALDLQQIVVSATAPSAPTPNQLWLQT